jgi:hypothetical protein
MRHGLQDDEERVPVDLQLWPLMRLDRVLDGELVELELAPDRLEFICRLEEADPHEGALAVGRLEGVLEDQLTPRRRPSS